MNELPIACTLDANDMTARLALIDELAADSLLDQRSTDTGVRLRLRDTAEIEQRMRELVAAEEKCCPFMGFRLDHRDGDLVLEITAPADVVPVVQMLFAPNVPLRS